MQLLRCISQRLRDEIPLTFFVGVMSFLTIVLFNIPFFRFVLDNVDYKSLNGLIIVIGLVIMMLIANAFVYYLIFYISNIVGRILLSIFFVANSIAIYFINTYNIILDESMIGNVLNTNYSEASSFFSFSIVLYVLLIGVLPSIYVFKAKIIKETWRRFIKRSFIALVFILVMIFANASNWLWIDKYSQQLGGLVMPWSYSVNIPLHYIHKYQSNRQEILLPDATVKDNEKAIVVLVIGESARSMNFSLYGYHKNTNPMLSKTENIFHFPATSCATYTTAGVKCILEHQNTNELYEILPNYLYRNNIYVVWRSVNWGEPPIRVAKYQNYDYLSNLCHDDDFLGYDEMLLKGLREEITSSDKNKILIVLHTSTSHGPSYNKKYPPKFEIFKPVCSSVELSKCTSEELINAYDNTIVYTDYILHRIIEELKALPEYHSTMIFVSDHGESLGEKNLYMHGVPMSFAPKEQYEIPFIVWLSEGYKTLKPLDNLSQGHVFHSILNFLSVESPVYNEELNVFK